MCTSFEAELAKKKKKLRGVTHEINVVSKELRRFESTGKPNLISAISGKLTDLTNQADVLKEEIEQMENHLKSSTEVALSA